jgi:hypothetical protein
MVKEVFPTPSTNIGWRQKHIALRGCRHWEDFRPGHDALVCMDRRSRAWPNFSGAPCLTRHSPGLCPHFLIVISRVWLWPLWVTVSFALSYFGANLLIAKAKPNSMLGVALTLQTHQMQSST